MIIDVNINEQEVDLLETALEFYLNSATTFISYDEYMSLYQEVKELKDKIKF